MIKSHSFLFLLIALVAISSFLFADQEKNTKKLSAEDYSRAEKFLNYNTDPLVLGADVHPQWINDYCFWYRNHFSDGFEFILVDATEPSRERAFDHKKLADALFKETREKYKPFQLPFRNIEFIHNKQFITFKIKNKQYQYDIQKNACSTVEAPKLLTLQSVTSPDEQYAAFIRDYNLWIRNLETNKEIQLTTDGEKNFGYATNNAGWTRSKRPVLLWSPDSRKIATFQHDGRKVRGMHLVSTQVGHPKLHSWKYPLPGDKHIFEIHRVVIHVDDPHVVRLQMPPDPHRSSVCDHVTCRGEGFADVKWNPHSSQLAFLSTSRNHKHVVLRISDPETGAVRDILEETVDTFFESGRNTSNWRVLTESKEVIWFSQRDNWGHLYLHDLETGEFKNRITQGNWNVLQVRRIDRENRMIYFTGAGREPGNPYFQYFYRIQMDGTNLELLTPEQANHSIHLSPSGNFFVDSYSTPVEPPVTLVRNYQGKKLLEIEEADISRLIESGWKPPVPFSVKARDGKTDLYGLMFKPTSFDPDKKYPIINYIYPGPQTGSVRTRSFAASRGDKQSLAELGFIVVALDAMGTPMRSKSFHDAYYGNMGDNGIPDQITGIKQLAERYSWIDIDRVGIYGHSGGGFASTDAILRYPDFFKVAVSGAGNHDNRNYEDDWGEKWQGLLKTNPDGTTNYDNQANQLLAKNLKGKLLLAHGTMDTNVPVYNTLLIVNELIAANKDFDLILFPNRGHGFGYEPYMIRSRWDYFVKHLMGAEPPKEYTFKKKDGKQ
ncbi:MAG: DPP IV N-terminal domain-containing protein [Candidatus Aminicenantaceae bacterium]